VNVSDVKVWDAPSIGRNDGMSVETKCYQHVVIWADYAKALMKVEDERDEANRVCEQWRQWTVATRADNEALRARVAELEAAAKRAEDALQSIGDEAHDLSTGPTVPDGYWRLREQAYREAEAIGCAGNKEGSR